MKKVPFVFMRCGTSKVVFFHEKNMPPRKNWDAFLLDVMGSPDMNQIDGLGGANSLTSKAAIISPSNNAEYAVNYTFAQVSIADATVHYNSNCGNASAGVIPFAVDEGLVRAGSGTVSVRFMNTNTRKILEAVVCVTDGKFVPEGDCAIPGVPGYASPVRIFFLNPEGAVTGKLLPTGRSVDFATTRCTPVAVSVVDAANPLVFFNAADIGLTGREMPDGFSAAVLAHIEDIRTAAAELSGIAPRATASEASPDVPKGTMISPPQDYVTVNGEHVRAEDMDICVRMVVMKKPHRAMALTGAVCTAVAALTPGTLVEQLVGNAFKSSGMLRIGHPGGIMHVPVEQDEAGGIKAGSVRTARRLAEGSLFTRHDHFIA